MSQYTLQFAFGLKTQVFAGNASAFLLGFVSVSSR